MVVGGRVVVVGGRVVVVGGRVVVVGGGVTGGVVDVVVPGASVVVVLVVGSGVVTVGGDRSTFPACFVVEVVAPGGVVAGCPDSSAPPRRAPSEASPNRAPSLEFVLWVMVDPPICPTASAPAGSRVAASMAPMAPAARAMVRAE